MQKAIASGIHFCLQKTPQFAPKAANLFIQGGARFGWKFARRSSTPRKLLTSFDFGDIIIFERVGHFLRIFLDTASLLLQTNPIKKLFMPDQTEGINVHEAHVDQ